MSRIPFLTAEWWRSTETPRWAIIAGALIMLALGVWLNMLSSIHVENQKRIDANRAEQIHLLLNDMAEYQSDVAAFANEMDRAKKVSPETRAALIKNLNNQFSRAREIESIVPEQGAQLTKLQKNIVALIEALPQQSTREAMLEFWHAVGSVTVTKNQLNNALQKSI